ncbi:MAG: hypothetical protein ICV74_03135 [Thermoleophilia bacterium]|nr:hypothetical protein [Thermoleophilia bacterium]
MTLLGQRAPGRGAAREERPRRRVRGRRLALPVAGGALALYVVLHSPLRRPLAELLDAGAGDPYFAGYSIRGVASALAALALLLAALLAALVVAEAFGGRPYERPLVVGLCGLGFVVVPGAALGGLASAAGSPLLRPPLGPLLVALPAAVVLVASLRRGVRPRVGLPRPPLTALSLTIGSLGLALLAAAVALGLAHPPTQGDALSYHIPLAVFLWEDGNLTSFLSRGQDVWALANPGSAELFYGLLRVAGGERAATLGQLPFALLAAAATGAFARRLGLRSGAALLAGSSVLLVPQVVMQAGMQANDVLAAALLMATIALAAAPLAEWTPARLALLGLGLGLTATTKLVLLPSVAGVLLFVLVALALRERSWRPTAKHVAILALALVAVTAPWWLRNLDRFGNPVYPARLPLLGRGPFVVERVDSEFVPVVAAWPAYPLLEPHDDRSGFGALLAVAVLPGALGALRAARRGPLLLYATVAATTLPAWWGLTNHEPRFLLALALLGLVSVPLALLAGGRRRRRAFAVVLGAAAVFSAAVTLDQALRPFARQPLGRAAFYDRVWGVDPAASTLPEREAIAPITGFGPARTDYTSYYPLLGPSQRRFVLPLDVAYRARSGATLAAAMRAAGVRYAYLAAVPDLREEAERLARDAGLELVHTSFIVEGERSGARRRLYRSTSEDDPAAIVRYLYRLP